MFYERLERLCETRGLTVAAACQLAGLHRSTHTVWRDGTVPSQRSLCALAQVLGTSVSYLVSGVECVDNAAEDGSLNSYVFNLLREVDRMDNSAKGALLTYAKELCAQ